MTYPYTAEFRCPFCGHTQELHSHAICRIALDQVRLDTIRTFEAARAATLQIQRALEIAADFRRKFESLKQIGDANYRS